MNAFIGTIRDYLLSHVKNSFFNIVQGGTMVTKYSSRRDDAPHRSEARASVWGVLYFCSD